MGFVFSAMLIASFLTGCSPEQPSVIIYTSQDEEFADPIFKNFEKATGIQVKAVYDSEAMKTVGLVNRLIAESGHPQCDVFWNNEELRTRLLATKNIFRETNGWALLGYRSRRLVFNTNAVPGGEVPANFSEATNTVWRGKVALAYPMYGTTATHFLALRQYWGDAKWQEWCKALVANKAMIVDGNSVAARQVAGGEAKIGFTDSDDAAAEQREGLPLGILPMGSESLVIHNSAGVVRGAAHAEAAQKLFAYLQSAEVEQLLVGKKALESPVPGDPQSVPGIKVNWDDLLRDLDAGTKEMETIFLR